MKSPVIVALAALGNSPWVPLDYLQSPFGVTLACVLDSAANLTYTVQYTYDRMDDDQQQFGTNSVSIARSGTTATVTDNAHCLVTGDAVITSATGDPNLDSAKDAAGRPIAQDVTVTGVNTYTYTVANTGATASTNAKVKRFRVFAHPILVTQTTRKDSNFNLPCQAVRLKVTVYSAGSMQMITTQGSSM